MDLPYKGLFHRYQKYPEKAGCTSNRSRVSYHAHLSLLQGYFFEFSGLFHYMEDQLMEYHVLLYLNVVHSLGVLPALVSLVYLYNSL